LEQAVKAEEEVAEEEEEVAEEDIYIYIYLE
jgi:hypothetical protein